MHQVKAHSVGVLLPLKPFKEESCWIRSSRLVNESPTIPSQFYLKDAAWSHSEISHLGPIVAARQIRHLMLTTGTLPLYLI